MRTAGLVALVALVLTPPLAALARGATGPGAVSAALGAEAVAPPELCRRAARLAAARHGVPEALMLAITLAETGRTRKGKFAPWPWTLNIAGLGVWYDSREEALTAAREALAAGRLSTDLGCFQINYRWHGEAFTGIEEMMDPMISADYAARHLAALATRGGGWLKAAGHYHSFTPIHASRYRSRVARILARLQRGDGGRGESPLAPRLASMPRPRLTTPLDGPLPLLPGIMGIAPARGPIALMPAVARGSAAEIVTLKHMHAAPLPFLRPPPRAAYAATARPAPAGGVALGALRGAGQALIRRRAAGKGVLR